MAHTTVSSCVLSIVASFSSGLDVFKKLRQKRASSKRRSKGNEKIEEDELRLARSLRKGPEDIGREYQHNIQTVGDDFALGDAIAQTSLAEILLKLNTGLVNIISAFLRSGKDNNLQLDYQSLTDLSERSRIDTCKALRQLHRRSMQIHRMPVIASREPSPDVPRTADELAPSGEARRVGRPEAKHPKIRGTTLARVVIQDSSKPSQIALVKPGERRRKSQSNSSSSNVSSSGVSHAPRSPSDPPSKAARRPIPRAQTAPEIPKSHRKPSTPHTERPPLPPKPEALRATRSTTRLPITNEQQPTLPPHAPMPAPMSVIEPRRRKSTPTYYSFASDSTKLGEIPLHQWAQPFDFDEMSLMNREAARNGWPLNQSDETRKKRGGLFRMFRR